MNNELAVIKLILAALVPVAISFVLRRLENTSPFKKLNNKAKQLIFGVTFGVCAILATQFGVEIDGAVLNVRDASPICAGLLFGAPAGIIAGVMGGAYRALVTLWGMGEYTVVACSIATALSGILAALLRKFAFKNKSVRWYYAFAVGVLCEITHMLLILLTNMDDLHDAFIYVQTCSLPMIAFCGLSVMLSAFCFSPFEKNGVRGEKGHKNISGTFQKYLILVMLSGFCVSTVFTYIAQTRITIRDTESVLRLNISDVANDISDAATRDMLKIALVIADELDGGAEVTSEALVSYSNIFNVYQLNYIDKNGIITASTSPEYIGYDMRSGQQSSEFLVLLEGEKRVYVQDYQPTSIDGSVSMRYVGVALLDGGFIQMGYDQLQRQTDVNLLVSKATENRHIGETGYIIIIDSEGKIISNAKGNIGDSIDSVGVEEESIVLDEVFTAAPYGEEAYCICLESEGFRALGVMPESEALFLRDVSMYLNIFMEALIFSAAFILVYTLVDKLMVRNIKKVNESLGEITEGNLDVVVNVTSSREFADLSEDINKTVLTLKEYIAEAEARIDKELEFARNIQLSSLPHVFPPYPNRKDFDIYACMYTAKEVGGDFYDFYFADKDKLCILIADVSGKGIPAAMFMMSAKTLIKGYVESGKSVSETLALTNNSLCENNDNNMFVTAWLGIVDMKTGVMEFANAGHNPPLLKRAEGDFEYLKAKNGLVLAIMEDMSYEKNTVNLLSGDKLYLYTDGVTEAMNEDNELYSEERLKATLNKSETLSPKELCEKVYADVQQFSGDAPQFDDITMLSLSYFGDSKREIKASVSLEELPRITEAVESFFTEHSMDFSAVIKMNIAIDEIFSNIVKFSGATYVLVTCEVHEGMAVLRFEDDGIPFDPTKKNDADTSLSLEDRPIGGMGILMVKKSMDFMEYEYKASKNILTLKKQAFSGKVD